MGDEKRSPDCEVDHDVVKQMPLPEEFTDDLQARIKVEIDKFISGWEKKADALIDQKVERAMAHAMKNWEENSLTQVLVESPDDAPPPKSVDEELVLGAMAQVAKPYIYYKPKPPVYDLEEVKKFPYKVKYQINQLLGELQEAKGKGDTTWARVCRNRLRKLGWHISKHGYAPMPLDGGEPEEPGGAKVPVTFEKAMQLLQEHYMVEMKKKYDSGQNIMVPLMYGKSVVHTKGIAQLKKKPMEEPQLTYSTNEWWKHTDKPGADVLDFNKVKNMFDKLKGYNLVNPLGLPGKLKPVNILTKTQMTADELSQELKKSHTPKELMSNLYQFFKTEAELMFSVSHDYGFDVLKYKGMVLHWDDPPSTIKDDSAPVGPHYKEVFPEDGPMFVENPDDAFKLEPKVHKVMICDECGKYIPDCTCDEDDETKEIEDAVQLNKEMDDEEEAFEKNMVDDPTEDVEDFEEDE